MTNQYRIVKIKSDSEKERRSRRVLIRIVSGTRIVRSGYTRRDEVMKDGREKKSPDIRRLKKT